MSPPLEELARLSPVDFCHRLEREGIRRFFLVRGEDPDRLIASHPVLEPLAGFVWSDERDHDAHEAIFGQIAPETGVLQAAFVHRTCRGQSAGGLRFWTYPTVEAFLRDGLRLSQGMTLKSALAGLWWGGGKGVMARGTGGDPADPATRRRIYEEYGAFVTGIGGCYVTAEDVGTTPGDMEAIFRTTRFATCVPPSVGGSGNPSPVTALGVAEGIAAALDHRGMGSIAGKTVALQGIGEVGRRLAGALAAAGAARIVAADIDARREATLRDEVPGIPLEFRLVERGDASILAEPCDVLAPCATGGVLGPETIPRIRAKIVCGAANNQLEDARRDDRALAARGIDYLPDFLVNRMGIVQCADEQYGVIDDDPRIGRHLGREWDNSVYNLSRRVLREAAELERTPQQVALEIAERRSHELHPLWGHRGRQIIDAVVRSDWSAAG